MNGTVETVNARTETVNPADIVGGQIFTGLRGQLRAEEAEQIRKKIARLQARLAELGTPLDTPLFSISWGKTGAVVLLDDRDISSTIERIECRETPEEGQRVWLCLVNSKVALSKELEGSVPLTFTREILDEAR